jgi:N-methylhydantoinase A
MLANGETLRPVDLDQAREVLGVLEQQGVESVAICLLHSYANPDHERAVKDLIASAAARPLFVTISSDLVREYREFERSSTTVLNAYVGPRVSGYLDAIQAYLDAGRFRGNAMIMQSSGGTMAIEIARDQPVRMMESGPVGGAVAAAHVAAQAGYDNVVAFDMGGTTAKVSIVTDGRIDIAEGYSIGGEEHGYPLQLPVVDVVEIGAGGGSIAHIDELGALKIGPQSAGATPGPAAYGKGGVRPTVTDANLVLGRLNPEYFLGGEIDLSIEAARVAIERDVAAPLKLEIARAAFGIVKIADTYMAHAVRQMTVQKGRDPRDFVLIAYGGGGPGHAVSMARELDIRTVVIPPYPGIFSAVGMLLSDAKESFVLSRIVKLADAKSEVLVAPFRETEAQGAERMRRSGFDQGDISYARSVDLRYVGQEFTLRIAVPEDAPDNTFINYLESRFADLHHKRYGHGFDGKPTEVVALHVDVFGHLPKPHIGATNVGSDAPSPASRKVYFEDEGYVDCAIYRREGLAVGAKVDGPAIIEETASTTLLHPKDRLSVDSRGNMVITVGAGGSRHG